MPRNKYPDVTVKKILDVSLELFLEKGFEQTTVLDIVAGLEGMTRGAFYHHFKSKDEVLDTILEQSFSGDKPELLEIMQNENLNGLQRLQEVMKLEMKRNADEDTGGTTNVVRLYINLAKSPRFFYEKFKNDLHTVEFFEPLIEQGMADGSIRQGNPKLYAELLMLLVNHWMFPELYPSNNCAKTMVEKGMMASEILSFLGFDVLDDEMGMIFESLVEIVTNE